MLKYFVFLLSITFITAKLYSQDEKVKSLYSEKEYVKCVKRCDQLITKNPADFDSYFYKAICYYAMSLKKSQYEEFTTQPVDEFLKTIIALRKQEEGEIYFKEKENKFNKLRDFANRFADKKVKGKQEATAMRIYKLVLRAFKPDYTQIDMIEVAFKVNDYYRAYSDIDRLFSGNRPEISAENPKYNDLLEAPGLIIKYYMFQNSLQLTEAYLEKFKNNKPIYSAMIGGLQAGMDTLVINNDYQNFFRFSEYAMKLSDDSDLRKHYFQKSLDVMDKYRIAYDTAPAPKTWKDTAQLRKYFKFLDISKQLAPFSEYDELKSEMEEKYHLPLPMDKLKPFSEIAAKVLAEIRSKGGLCNHEEWINVDPLQWSYDLYSAAEAFARERFAYSKLDYGDKFEEHTDLKGRGPKERVDETGLKAKKVNTFSGIMFYGATEVGETTASGSPLSGDFSMFNMEQKIRSIIKFWLDWEQSSADDCNTVMKHEYSHFGLAVYGDRWVMVVAKVIDIRD